ncbi:hypothetical protein BC832DRAFT_543391 [Gaertneriomyces semiglobifer]|nr:hypothetical protein BC832DRAFT_543391 [Gaertneriomyces semiglobifer]
MSMLAVIVKCFRPVRLISRPFDKLFWLPATWGVLNVEPDLRELRRLYPTLKGAVAFNRQLLHRIFVKCGSAIRQLQCSNLQPTTLDSIANHCNRLRELSLKSMKPNYLLDALSTLSMNGIFIKLERLDITMENYRATSFDANSMKQLMTFIASSCPNLRELHFVLNGYITIDGLSSLIRGCQNIERLSLASCHLFGDDEIELITGSEFAAKLKYLCLMQYTPATDEQLFRLAHHLPNLEIIVIHHAERITNAGIQAFAGQCHRLRWVKILGCRQVTLGVLDNFGFESRMNCPVVYPPQWPVELGFGYEKVVDT